MEAYKYGDKVIFNKKEATIIKEITNYSTKKTLYELSSGDIVEGDVLSRQRNIAELVEEVGVKKATEELLSDTQNHSSKSKKKKRSNK